MTRIYRRSVERLYICGPMTGLAESNIPAFRYAEEQLRRHGYVVLNPADNQLVMHDNETPADMWQEYMRMGLRQLIQCDGIALLPNWTGSRGASFEVYTGTVLGMTIMIVDDWCRAGHTVVVGGGDDE